MAKSDPIAPIAGRRRSRGRLIALALALSLLAVACSDDDTTASSTTTDPDRSSSSTTSTTTSSTTTTEPATTSATSAPGAQTTEEEIVAAYIGYWNARFEANSGTPNPNDPALREFATGAQLDAVIAETQANLDQGLAFRRADNPANVQRVEVVDVDGDQAVVQECVVSDGVIIRRDTGEVVNDEVATHNVRGELTRVDGVWRVSAAQLVQRWDGVAGCASDS